MASLTLPETWPRELMREQLLRWTPMHHTTVSEASIGGVVQATDSLGGPLWQCAFGDVDIRGGAIEAAWDALMWRLKGAKTPVLVPCTKNRLWQPWPTIGGQVVRRLDQIPFEDGSGYDDGAWNSQHVIVVTVSEAVPARAMRLRVTSERAGPLREGQRFSVDHPLYGRRMYGIGRVHGIFGSDDVEIEIHRPLFAGLAAGDGLDFDAPGVVMRLFDEESSAYDMRRMRFGQVSPVLVEAF